MHVHVMSYGQESCACFRAFFQIFLLMSYCVNVITIINIYIIVQTCSKLKQLSYPRDSCLKNFEGSGDSSMQDHKT